MRVTSLGSGSKGNATLVEYENTLLLIDSGFSCKELELRLNWRSISANQVSAILVTHEHHDHLNGVPALANKYNIPVWMSPGTSFHPKAAKIKHLNLFNSHTPFSLEKILVTPVAVPHDSREACQFVFKTGKTSIGLLTDLGHITPFVCSQFQQCDILLLEFNHDKHLLSNSRYPASLKSRIGGGLGHLNNDQAISFVRTVDWMTLKYLVAMHISEENNSQDLVRQAVDNLGLNGNTRFLLAKQDVGFDWISI